MASKKITMALEKNVLMLREEAKRLVYYYDQALYLEQENLELKKSVDQLTDENQNLALDKLSLTDDVKTKDALIKQYLKEFEDKEKEHRKEVLSTSRSLKSEFEEELKHAKKQLVLEFAQKQKSPALNEKIELLTTQLTTWKERLRERDSDIKRNHSEIKKLEAIVSAKQLLEEKAQQYKESLKESTTQVALLNKQIAALKKETEAAVNRELKLQAALKVSTEDTIANLKIAHDLKMAKLAENNSKVSKRYEQKIEKLVETIENLKAKTAKPKKEKL